MSGVQSEEDRALYEELASEINPTFTDRRGGVDLEYHTGEQITSKLNETLGFLNWSFVVIEHGIHAEADECWCLGELTVMVGERIVKRQQFGSQKVKRSRSSGTPLDIGFDLKGAATDALKKCASLIGVGLYLWAKAPPVPQQRQDRPTPLPQGQSRPGGSPTTSSGGGPGSLTKAMQEGGDLEPFYCEECQEPLTDTKFKDGTNWAASQLAVFGRRKHSRILCMTHYREANQAKRRAEEALQQVPF